MGRYGIMPPNNQNHNTLRRTPRGAKERSDVTNEEREFMSGLRGKGGKSAPVPPDARAQAREWGREGMRRRWGEHGETKTIRVFTETAERFRAFVPHERDRAAAATEALNGYLDAHGAPMPERKPKICIRASLTYHWYDEIAAGRKTVEYREINPYWESRLWEGGRAKDIGAIEFSRGYTNTRMKYEVVRIERNELDGVFEIYLGKRMT